MILILQNSAKVFSSLEALLSYIKYLSFVLSWQTIYNALLALSYNIEIFWLYFYLPNGIYATHWKGLSLILTHSILYPLPAMYLWIWIFKYLSHITLTQNLVPASVGAWWIKIFLKSWGNFSEEVTLKKEERIIKKYHKGKLKGTMKEEKKIKEV